MQRLYKSELRFAAKQKKKLSTQRNALVYSLTPLKDILRIYNELSNRGFNSEATVETLKNLSRVMRARGYADPRVFGDYSAGSELDQSLRMQKLVDDVKFGLRREQFFSPKHLAEVNIGLAEIGYKNTTLIPLVFDKLHTQLDERQLDNGTRFEQHHLEFKDAVYGGPQGMIDRHYVFKGFQGSEEFNQYLQILMDWEKSEITHNQASETNAATPQLSSHQRNDDKHANDIQRAMGDIVNAAVQVKELQKDYQASIDNLRQQYFMMSEASDKHTFLQDNQYIKYDLLELQELLVKGGYIDPEEASNVLTQEPFDSRMSRAADVFYDYVLNYAPELLSPQHSNFYEAAITNPQVKQQHNLDKSTKNYLEENQNVLSLRTLSQTLVGLADQSLSYRRDAHGQDYLNKFYEDLLLPLEKHVFDNKFKGLETKLKLETVMMERAYLKSWQLFKEGAARIVPRLINLIREEKDSLEGQLNALGAMNACRVEEHKVRQEVVANCIRMTSNLDKVKIEQEGILAGLRGLAGSPSPLDEQVRLLSSRLSSIFDPTTLKNFPDQLDALWSLCALQQYDSNALTLALKQLNSINFERIESDLKYEEFLKLFDVHNALRFESPLHFAHHITSPGLVNALHSNKDLFLNFSYREHSSKYDPFKQRVVQALSKGLTGASVQHQVIAENEMYQAQTLEADVLNSDKYPYKPDIIMGYKGQKVGVFVLPETNTMFDTHNPTGQDKFRQRLLQAAHLKCDVGLKIATIAVDQVVNYDIQGLKLNLNEKFNFISTLESQIGKNHAIQQLDFQNFSAFGAKLISQAAGFIESQSSEKEINLLDSLIQRLFRILQTKQQTELRIEPLQRAAGHDEVRFQMMKVSLLYDTLSEESRKFVDQVVREEGAARDFKSLLKQTIDTVPRGTAQQRNSNPDATTMGLDASWLGTRLEVELPAQAAALPIGTKSIVPELLNQRFMWVDDYFHYSDWKLKQKQVFDNFNLLQVPHTEAQDLYYFDNQQSRRVPQGVFPYPNHKRQLMLPASNHTLTQEFLKSKNHDDFVLFEKEPFKLMVINELKKTETLAPIDDDTSMITNLQNVKQGLKSDFSDKEILNTILLNLNFTEQLIEEHLQIDKKGKNTKDVRLLPRDTEGFRNFVESTYHSKKREDPYTHFYLKEARNKELIKGMIEEEKQLYQQTEENSADSSVLEKGEARRQALQEKIETLLLEDEQQNEDLLNLSDSLKTHVQVNYDLKTLIKSEQVYDVDPELHDKAISNEEYLESFRRRAETKLIKSKIIYKLYGASDSQQAGLTQLEKQYLKKWVADLKGGDKYRNLLNLRDSMVPEKHTQLSFKEVNAKSLYTLNTIARVQIERERHSQYSISDLVVELSHFLDEDVVNKVETEIYQEKMKQEWGLSKDFKAVESRNKEISLVLNELEELAWRSAGQLNETDLKHLKAMISVKRNKDYFDKQFYPQDMKSLETFFNEANMFDQRIPLLERWLVRKEDEIQSRVNTPPTSLQKSDQELYNLIDNKRARERLTAKLLMTDEFGNQIEKKEYKDMNSRELHVLAENLCLRMYLFNYDYPAFLPQVVRATLEHPSLLRSDRDQLELYSRLFELDWRGDRTYQNKTQFMSSNPIYLDGTNLKAYGEITNEVVKDKLQRACAPYVEETAKRIVSQASQ